MDRACISKWISVTPEAQNFRFFRYLCVANYSRNNGSSCFFNASRSNLGSSRPSVTRLFYRRQSSSYISSLFSMDAKYAIKIDYFLYGIRTCIDFCYQYEEILMQIPEMLLYDRLNNKIKKLKFFHILNGRKYCFSSSSAHLKKNFLALVRRLLYWN